MPLVMLGLSHKSASVELREALALEGQLPQAYAQLKAGAGVDELVLLSTCNRVEAYAVAPDPMAAEAQLRARIDAIADPDLRYDLEIGMFAEASELDPEHPLVAAVARVVAAATTERPDVIGMTFTTDARFVRNQLGIPAVVCGPGDVAQAHTNDEWVALDRLVQATAAYASLYTAFGAASPAG